MCTVLLPPGDNPTAVNKYIQYINVYVRKLTPRLVMILWAMCWIAFDDVMVMVAWLYKFLELLMA